MEASKECEWSAESISNDRLFNVHIVVSNCLYANIKWKTKTPLLAHKHFAAPVHELHLLIGVNLGVYLMQVKLYH